MRLGHGKLAARPVHYCLLGSGNAHRLQGRYAMITTRQAHALGFYRSGIYLFPDFRWFDPTILLGFIV
jgi:hypothetical protein